MTDLVYGTVVPTLADFGGAPAVRGDIFCNLLTEKVYIAGDGTVIEIGGAGGMAIGAPVIDGDDTRVLFIRDDGSGPVLAQDDNFRFAPSISVLFIGPVTGPGEYSQISRDGFYSASAGAVDFISLDNTDGSATLSSLAGVGTRSIAADANGKIVVGGGTQTFTPTIIPFADGAGVLTESASLFWDGNYVNAPGIKMAAGGDNTLIRQSTNNLQIFAGATQIANFTPNNGAGGVDFRVYPQAYAALGSNGAAPANDNITYALNSSTTASSHAGLWAGHNSSATGVSYLDLFRYAASVVNNGWRMAVQQSTGDDLRFFITGAGGSSDLIASLSRDAGLFLKNTAARPAVLSNFGFAWADTEGSIALSGPNGDYFHWYHTKASLAIGYGAMALLADADNDIAIGKGAMGGSLLSGGYNVAIGAAALKTLNHSSSTYANIAIGPFAMSGDTITGERNIAIGEEAAKNITAGTGNIAIGGEATLKNITTGIENIALGAFALQNVDGGDYNIGIGRQTLQECTADKIVGIGFCALTALESGVRNTAVGSGASVGALGAIVSSSDNTALGWEAGKAIGSGAQNTFLGSSADGAASSSNQTAVGYGATATGANQVVIGNTSVVDTFLRGKLNLNNKIFPGTDAAAAQTATGIYGNTGAPNNANGANGDFYFRADGAALSTIYQRRAGVWVGVV